LPGDGSFNALTTQHANTFVLDQAFYLCLGQLYSLTYNIKLATYSNTKYSQLVTFGGSFTRCLLLATHDGANGTWNTRMTYFVAKYGGEDHGGDPTISSVSLSVSAYHRRILSFSIDNLVVVPATASVDPNAASVVLNGGFETGRLGPFWGTSGAYPNFTGVGSPGISSRYGYIVRQGDDGFPTGTVLSQNVTVVPGTIYVFGIDYISNSYGRDRNRGDVEITGRDPLTDKEVSYYTDNMYPPAGSFAGSYRIPFVAESSFVSFALSFGVDASEVSQQSNFTVDNFFMTKMASP